jgi:hypothetical protein
MEIRRIGPRPKPQPEVHGQMKEGAPKSGEAVTGFSDEERAAMQERT